MKVLVLGASGRTGCLIVSEVFRQGHEGTALTRHPKKVRSHAGRLRIYKGAVSDPEALDLAMAGQDAVVYALGCKISLKPVTFFSETTRLVLDSMRNHNVRRLVCITAAGIGDSKGHGGDVLENPLVGFAAKQICLDKERQEQMIRGSDREWVIVRPALLLDGKATRQYSALSILEPEDEATRISRADVAEFCVSQLTSDEFLYQTPLLTY